MTTLSPPPLDNRALASSYRQFQYVHYLYREYQCILLYLFPSSIFIAFITVYRNNQRIGFMLSSISMCLLFVSWKSVVFCWWSSLIRDLNVLFLQGYFSIFPISPPPTTSLPFCPEDWWKCLLLPYMAFCADVFAYKNATFYKNMIPVFFFIRII